MIKAFSLFFLLCWAIPARADFSLIERVQRTENSIVEVKTVYAKVIKTPQGSRMVSFERNGAGIVIDASGLVVTNTHTIVNAPHIFVILRDGTKLEAQVAFVSMERDFSFLKINPPRPLKPIAWAESSQVQLGQDIVAIGNSDYDNQSILAGQVTSLLYDKHTGTNEMIQVNLNLYRGDSGGPILDTQGRLLGIIMAKRKSEDRASFAIASDKIREQYLRYKQNM